MDSNERAQVSIDYLIMITFVLVFVIAVALVVTVLTNVSTQALNAVLDVRASAIANLMR